MVGRAMIAMMLAIGFYGIQINLKAISKTLQSCTVQIEKARGRE